MAPEHQLHPLTNTAPYGTLGNNTINSTSCSNYSLFCDTPIFSFIVIYFRSIWSTTSGC